MSTISIRRKGLNEYKQMWSKIFEDVGIWNLLKDNTKILIKPNWVTSKLSDTGVTTDIALVKALVEVLSAETRLEVVVGESAISDTEEVFSYLDVSDLERFGCQVVNFDQGQWISVESPLKLVFDRFLIPKVAYNADVIFILGKMKTHALTGVSLGLKNLIGMISRGGRKVMHLRDIDKAIIDVFAYFQKTKILISAIDGLVALEGERGPTHGTPVRMDCLFTSDDPLLADITCAQAMGVEWEVIRHLRLANQFDLGKSTPLSTSGLSIHDVLNRFVMPNLSHKVRTPWDEWLANKLFYKYPKVLDGSACIQCRRCEKICPVGCVKLMKTGFTYQSSACIHCLCCVEACPTGALGYEVKNKKLYQRARNVWRKILAYRQS